MFYCMFYFTCDRSLTLHTSYSELRRSPTVCKEYGSPIRLACVVRADTSDWRCLRHRLRPAHRRPYTGSDAPWPSREGQGERSRGRRASDALPSVPAEWSWCRRESSALVGPCTRVCRAPGLGLCSPGFRSRPDGQRPPPAALSQYPAVRLLPTQPRTNMHEIIMSFLSHCLQSIIFVQWCSQKFVMEGVLFLPPPPFSSLPLFPSTPSPSLRRRTP